MKEYHLEIFLRDEGCVPKAETLAAAFQNINCNFYCFFRPEKNKRVLETVGLYLTRQNPANKYELIVEDGDFAFEAAVNRHSLETPCPENHFILFLSSTIHPEPDSIRKLLACLDGDSGLCGVNPILISNWNGCSTERVAFMGAVFDCRKQLHYLYEGMEPNNHLARKKRCFQIAHPGFLLLRKSDFVAAGGFQLQFKNLVFHELCANLNRPGKKGFAIVPDARGRQSNIFDSWEFCGAWNSILQRGRLNADNFQTDYPFMARADGLEYGLDPWLCEFAHTPCASAGSALDGAWLEWRRHPNPLSLLKFVACLPDLQKRRAIALARSLAASLPRLAEYYQAQAKKVGHFALEHALENLAAQTAQWLARRRRFEHGVLKPGIKLLINAGIYNCSLDESPAVFDAWVETAEKFEKIEAGCEWPKIAVVMPVWNPRPEFLVQALESVKAQKYVNWQLCIADDASTNPQIRDILRDRAKQDKRVSLKFREQNGHICAATNSALDLVDAPFTAFLDHDDLLAPEALLYVARHAAKFPQTGFIYTDEDRIDVDNVRRSPAFKQDFDCDLFQTGHLSTYSTAILRECGGLRTGFEGSQDLDLRLRITEILKESQIFHIPHILYHWRVHAGSTAASLAAKPYVLEATKKAWQEAGKRRNQLLQLSKTTLNNVFRQIYDMPTGKSCGLVLFTDNEKKLTAELHACLHALQGMLPLTIYIQTYGACGKDIYPQIELPFTKLPFAGESWIAACNAAAAAVDGDIVLFLDMGLRPCANCRPEQLLIAAMRQDIALAGGMIWRNGHLMNGGWYPDVSGLPFPLLRGVPHAYLNSFAWGEFLLSRHTIGSPRQCMAIRRDLVNGKEFLNPAFGELAVVDFCLRQSMKKRHTLISPWSQWEHDEPMTEQASAAQQDLFLSRWGERVKYCGLRNPNLRAAPDYGWTLLFDN